jgi:hypothetical protein
MKSESDPIDDDELLIRRIHRDRYKTDRVPKVSASGFEPRYRGNDPDTTGISLYRLACLQHADDVLLPVPEEKRRDQALVTVSVRFLKSLGLSVRSESDGAVAGHVVIPELNSGDYEANKTGFTKYLKDLANESSNNVLREPASKTNLASD